MFDKLKQKLKNIKERITGKISAEPVAEVPEAPEAKPEALPEIPREEVKPGAKIEHERPPAPVAVYKAPAEILPEAPPAAKEPRAEPKPPEIAPARGPRAAPALPAEKPRKGLVRAVKRLAGREITADDIDDVVWDLQVAMLESDVAVPAADQIIERVKRGLVGKKIGLRTDVKKIADEVLRNAIRGVLESGVKVDLLKIIEEKRASGEPAVFVFVGINGHGKTTTIAKLAKYLMDRGYKSVLAAGDTFRAAGIEQLEIHAKRLGVDIIKQRRGADAAAVAYDAISHARARRIDAVLVDTAGRMQTNVNLMDEMKKIVRVAKPDAVIFVGDALTGNDAIEQARTFDKAIGITGSILCKMDADARGGAALSITHVTGKPILFIGTGQGYDDLVEFNPDIILNALFSD
jgi:fused signal recognition particle receptor